MGMGFKENECFIISDQGKQSYFGYRDDIHFGDIEFEISSDFLATLSYLPQINKAQIAKSGIILQNENTEVFIPRLNNHISSVLKSGAEQLRKAILISPEIEITIDYKELIENLTTASKLNVSKKEECILDIQIKDNNLLMLVPNAFESKIECSSSGYKANEYSEFGLHLKPFIGCIKQIRKV